jgi:hypothetical protein
MTCRDRDERGSIIMVVLVSMVVTILAVSIVATVTQSLSFSRKAGDSANALQLADAGVNDAIQVLPNQVGPTYNSGGCAQPCSVSLGLAGSYKYTATADSSGTVWHITSWGTDAHGQQRKVRADAAAESLFGNAFFIYSTALLKQGTIDSFTDGSTAQRMCTGHGTVGSDSGGTWFGTNGGGNSNCENYTYGISWPYSVDGCNEFSSATPLPAAPTTGSGQCPANATNVLSPAFSPPQVVAPGGSAAVAQPAVCDGSNGVGHTTLKAQANGQPYFWTSVTLRPPCQVDPSNGPVVIYSAGTIDIGDANGNSAAVNSPLLTSAQCSAVTYTASKDLTGNPSSDYCPSWSSNLRIFQLSGVSGTAANVMLRNHLQFWGVIDAPSGCVQCGQTGTPHAEVWGATVTNSFNANAQLTLHFDDALGRIGTGRYNATNWREEPLP